MGYAGAAIAILLLVMLLVIDAPRVWRLALLAPLWMAALGFLQAREKTWVTLASRGSRDMTGRIERVEDSVEREQLRAKARGVRMRALIAALLLTIATLFLR